MTIDEIAINYLLDKTCDNCDFKALYDDGFCCDVEETPENDVFLPMPAENTCLSWELKRLIDSQSLTTSRLNASSVTAGSISIV